MRTTCAWKHHLNANSKLWAIWSKLTPIYWEGHERDAKNKFILWRNRGDKTLVLLTWNFLKSSPKFHTYSFMDCVQTSPSFFKKKLSMCRVVLMWNVIDKSNCYLILKYDISKQNINTTNNLDQWKHYVILCHQERGSIPSSFFVTM